MLKCLRRDSRFSLISVCEMGVSNAYTEFRGFLGAQDSADGKQGAEVSSTLKGVFPWAPPEDVGLWTPLLQYRR